jgi:hypothetical protein
LESWQSGATRFRKMTVSEHMAWIENRTNQVGPPPDNTTGIQDARPTVLPPQPRNLGDGFVSAANQPVFSADNFRSPMPLQTTSGQANGVVKKPRKIRSDAGKPRRKRAEIPGAIVFHSATQ